MSQLFASGGQSAGASASVLPMNTQDRSLGLTGLISLQSKGLSIKKNRESSISKIRHERGEYKMTLQKYKDS